VSISRVRVAINLALLLAMLMVALAWGGATEPPGGGPPGPPGSKQRFPIGGGTAQIGIQLFPPNFGVGIAPGARKTLLGIEMTGEQLTNPLTVVELVVEISYDGAQSWPPECVSTVNCRCHDASQDGQMPANAAYCALTIGGAAPPTPVFATECQWSGRETDGLTRIRTRMLVCGAPATGEVSLTWR